jgi:hypothetical protein
MATRPKHYRILNTLDLSQPEMAWVWEFHAQTNPALPIQSTVRDLLLMAGRLDPLNPAAMNARRNAYAVASYEVRTKLAAALRAISAEQDAAAALEGAHTQQHRAMQNADATEAA